MDGVPLVSTRWQQNMHLPSATASVHRRPPRMKSSQCCKYKSNHTSKITICLFIVCLFACLFIHLKKKKIIQSHKHFKSLCILSDLHQETKKLSLYTFLFIREETIYKPFWLLVGNRIFIFKFFLSAKNPDLLEWCRWCTLLVLCVIQRVVSSSLQCTLYYCITAESTNCDCNYRLIENIWLLNNMTISFFNNLTNRSHPWCLRETQESQPFKEKLLPEAYCMSA